MKMTNDEMMIVANALNILEMGYHRNEVQMSAHLRKFRNKLEDELKEMNYLKSGLKWRVKR